MLLLFWALSSDVEWQPIVFKICCSAVPRTPKLRKADDAIRARPSSERPMMPSDWANLESLFCSSPTHRVQDLSTFNLKTTRRDLNFKSSKETTSILGFLGPG
jgi:hypothetical protein